MSKLELEVGKTYMKSVGTKVSITDISNVNSRYIYVGDDGGHYDINGEMMGGLVGADNLSLAVSPLLEEKSSLRIEIGKTYINEYGTEVSIVDKFGENEKYTFVGDDTAHYSSDGLTQSEGRFNLSKEKEVINELVTHYPTKVVYPDSEEPKGIGSHNRLFNVPPPNKITINLTEGDKRINEVEINVSENSSINTITINLSGVTHTIRFDK